MKEEILQIIKELEEDIEYDTTASEFVYMLEGLREQIRELFEEKEGER